MKKLLVILPVILMTACASTGPAEDPFDEEDKEAKISIGGILGTSSKKSRAKAKAENDALRARIEKLEQDKQDARDESLQARIERLENNTQGGGNAGNSNSNNSSNNSVSRPGPDSVSFREWSKARDKGSSEYDEFKEYQKWLEFKRFKEQSKK